MPPAIWTVRAVLATVRAAVTVFAVRLRAPVFRVPLPVKTPVWTPASEGVKAPRVDNAFPPHELAPPPEEPAGALAPEWAVPPAAGGRGMRTRGCPTASAASVRLARRYDSERHEKGRSGQQCAPRRRVTLLAVDGLHRILLRVPWSLDPSRNRPPRIPRCSLRCPSDQTPDAPTDLIE